MKHPEWLKTALFYEIYPQSFYDSNGDGIGDLNGIIEKLDYIQSIGFNALWLNPIFDSPFYDAGYDVTDYYTVAKRYGTNEDAYRLFKEVHRRGMHILLDLVPGHTSLQCDWFIQSAKAKLNRYSDRYIWTNSVWDSPDLPCIRGFSERNGCCLTNFFSIQPALNYGFTNILHPEYEEPVEGKGPQSTIKAMIDVIEFWLKKGADGFRCDMAGWLVKRDPEGKGTQKVWQQIFAKVRRDFPQSAFVAEWNRPDLSLETGFDMDFLLQDVMIVPMNAISRSKNPYFRGGKETDSEPFMRHIEKMYCYAKKHNAYLSMISGNHDTERIRKTLAPEELKTYYAFMYTLPSVPFLYYGDEIGMKYEENLTSVEGGYQRTGDRSPMQWDKSKKAGFSTCAKTYIPINPDRKGISVEEELNDPNSLLCFLKNFLAFRKEHPALDNDAITIFPSYGLGKPILYEREKGSEKLLLAFNQTGKDQEIKTEGYAGEVLFANCNLSKKDDSFLLPDGGFMILR